MVTPSEIIVSKNRVNRAAEKVLDLATREQGWEGLTPAERGQFAKAMNVLTEYRELHAYPLQLVTMGLRSMVQSETGGKLVAQRLKRMPKIIEKLRRHRGMKLARMQDVGGCRAVLLDNQQVEGVARRVSKKWEIVRTVDYRQEPRSTGYRGLHFVVERCRPGWTHPRHIEVQLRTLGQHVWAETVLGISQQTDYNLQDGEGPPELLRYLRLGSDMITAAELKEQPGEELVSEFESLKPKVNKYLRVERR